MAKEKNPAAVQLGSLGGKARAEGLTPEELSRIAYKGALARNAQLNAEQRSEAARKAVRTRWANRKQAEREIEEAGQGGLERFEEVPSKNKVR